MQRLFWYSIVNYFGSLSAINRSADVALTPADRLILPVIKVVLFHAKQIFRIIC